MFFSFIRQRATEKIFGFGVYPLAGIHTCVLLRLAMFSWWRNSNPLIRHAACPHIITSTYLTNSSLKIMHLKRFHSLVAKEHESAAIAFYFCPSDPSWR
jgi:hypothetical protein